MPKLTDLQAHNNNLFDRLKRAEHEIEQIKAFVTPALAPGGAETGGSSGLVMVSGDDYFPGYLGDKVTSQDGSVDVVITDGGADEKLDVSVTTFVQAEIATEIAAHAAVDDAHHDPVTQGYGIVVTGQQVAIDTSVIAELSDLHAPVTLAGGSDPILTLVGQQLSLGNVATQAELDSHAANASAHHAAVTLGTDADVLLGLTGQQITLASQTANRVFAGPASGGSADPTFRLLVEADLPSTVQTGDPDELASNRFVSIFKNIPGGRGFWPPSHIRAGGELADIIAANPMTNNGNAQFSFTGLFPWIDLNGSSQYFSVADTSALDITGTESYIASAARGLTIGGWFYFDTTASTVEALMSKWLGASNFSYILNRQSGGNIRFSITSGGTSATQDFVDSSGTVGANAWTFVVGRFTPSTELAVFVNGTKTTETSGIAASIFSGSANFEIGSLAGGSSLLNGRYGGGFLSMMALSDTVIDYLFQSTRGLPGV